MSAYPPDPFPSDSGNKIPSSDRLAAFAERAVADGLDLAEAEQQLTDELDAAIFDAEHDLAHGHATPAAHAHLARLQARRQRLLDDWYEVHAAASYRADKLAELDEAPDAATAAAAVTRWNVLGPAYINPPPLPVAEAPALPQRVSPSEVHAAVLHHVVAFSTQADNPDSRPPRVLLVAETGSRKTGIALAHMHTMIEAHKAARLPYRAIMLVPAHRLGREIEQRAHSVGINAALFQGRGDRRKPDQPCRNLEAVELARRACALRCAARVRVALAAPGAIAARILPAWTAPKMPTWSSSRTTSCSIRCRPSFCMIWRGLSSTRISPLLPILILS
jgi:hypothetical protein